MPRRPTMTILEREMAGGMPAPDWRWQRALDVRQNGWPTRCWYDDLWLRTAVNLQRYDDLPAPSPRGLAAQRMQWLSVARHWQTHDPMHRLALQMRLFAGQSLADIAAACDCPLGVVQAFAATFCFLPDKLSRAAALRQCQAFDSWEDPPFDLTARNGRWLAWQVGPRYVDELIQLVVHGPHWTLAADLSTPQGRRLERMRLALWRLQELGTRSSTNSISSSFSGPKLSCTISPNRSKRRACCRCGRRSTVTGRICPMSSPGSEPAAHHTSH